MEQNASLEADGAKLVEHINSELTGLSHKFELPSLLHFLIATVAAAGIFSLIKFIFRKISDYLDPLKEKHLHSLSLKGLVVLDKAKLSLAVDLIYKAVQLTTYILVIYSYLTYAFSIFPATQGIAAKLLNYVLHLFSNTLSSAISFIPNLVTITFIVVITYYFLKLGRFFTRSAYFRSIIFPGFKTEWVLPTYNIAKFFIIAFAAIMIFPYLPGSKSPAFQGVSVFIGVLFTIGSSTAISNIIAGVVMIYMSPFRVGDRVKVDDMIGDITEMGLLVTRIRTIKNEEVTIPNSYILSRETVNYSSSAKASHRLTIPIPITIGYEVPKNKVKELLIQSTKNIESIVAEPKPFVLITELDGSYIAYELNVQTDRADKVLQIKSDLRENIIDNFNAESIEILSPMYISTRDGNKSTIN